MAMLQLKCPETGKPVDLHDVPAEEALLPIGGAAKVWRIPCPYCGGSHTWTSSGFAMAMGALRDSPDAARVLVGDGSATALP